MSVDGLQRSKVLEAARDYAALFESCRKTVRGTKAADLGSSEVFESVRNVDNAEADLFAAIDEYLRATALEVVDASLAYEEAK